MKKIGIIFSILMACLFVSCGKETVSTVEIWHTYNGMQKDALEASAQAFNESQSKYVVKVLAQDSSSFADSVYNAVANGIGPSIIFNYGSTAVDYAKNGLAVNIQNYIDEDLKKGDSTMKDLIESLPPAMKMDIYGFSDGGIYYVPGCTTGPVFFYNKTQFNKLGLNPPKDWDELEAVSKKYYEATGKAAFHSDGLVDNIQAILMQNACGYIDVANKKVSFTENDLAKIYQWYADCCNKGYFEFNTVGKYSSEDLANGTIGSFSGSCVNDQYITMLGGDELGMAPWIGSSNGVDFYTAWNRGPIFLKRADDVDRGAYEFVKFFLSGENGAKWAIANSALTPYGKCSETQVYKDYINNIPATSALPCVQANMDYSGSFPNVTGAAQVRNILVKYLNYTVDGQMTSKEAAAACIEDCNTALNK